MSDSLGGHHDLAMDDSIDSESFRNGSGQSNTHGSHLSSNSCRTASRQSSEHSAIQSKLLSPFHTPAKSGTGHHLASLDRSPGFSAPSATTSPTWEGYPSFSEGGSGVLVSESAGSSSVMKQSQGRSSRAFSNGHLSGRNHPLPSLVSYEDSPLARAPRKGSTHKTSNPSKLSTFAGWGDGPIPIREASSGVLTEMQEDAHGQSAKPASACGWGCCGSRCQPAKSEMQAYCRTATPGPSENGKAEMYRYGRCWYCAGDGCQRCYPVWSSGGPALGEMPGANSPSTGDTIPNTIASNRWHYAASTLPSQNPVPVEAAEVGLSKIGETPKMNKNAVTIAPTGTQQTVVDVACRHGEQGVVKAKKKESDPGEVRLAAFSDGLQIDHEASLRSLEENVAQRLNLLDRKVCRLGDGGQHANAQNNVASVFSDGPQGSGLRRADLDLRDLNKQVLKMDLYGKFKREQELNDRLTRIEEGLAAKQIRPGSRTGGIHGSREMIELRRQLTQQRQEIDGLKQEAAFMPEVRAVLVNLGNEATLTRDRLNSLENIAYEQQRGLHHGAQEHGPEATGARRTTEAYAASMHLNNDACAGGHQLDDSAAHSLNSTKNVKWDELHGWAVPFSAPCCGQNSASSGGYRWRARSQVSLGEQFDSRGRGCGQSSPPPQVYQPPAPQRGASWAVHCQGASDEYQGLPYSPPHAWFPSSQGGQGWGGTSQVCYDDGQRGGGGWCNPFSSDSRSKAPTGTSSVEEGPFVFNNPIPFREQELYAASEPSFGAYSPEQRAQLRWRYLQNSEGSHDARGRAPTVETIVDEEDEFKPFASRTQKSSWDMVSSRPRTTTLPTTTSQGFDRSSAIESGEWINLGPKQTSVASMSPSNRTRSPVASAGEGFRCGRGGALPTCWPSTAAWGAASNSARRSSNGSRDHWRRPTTPSKWKSEGGRGEENVVVWD